MFHVLQWTYGCCYMKAAIKGWQFCEFANLLQFKICFVPPSVSVAGLHICNFIHLG